VMRFSFARHCAIPAMAGIPRLSARNAQVWTLACIGVVLIAWVSR
jgi:hypothetical protein